SAPVRSRQDDAVDAQVVQALREVVDALEGVRHGRDEDQLVLAGADDGVDLRLCGGRVVARLRIVGVRLSPVVADPVLPGPVVCGSDLVLAGRGLGGGVDDDPAHASGAVDEVHERLGRRLREAVRGGVDDEECVHDPRIPWTRHGRVPAVRYSDDMTTFRDALRTGSPQVGLFALEFSTDGIGAIAARAGLDWILYDLEHTGWSLDAVRSSIAVSRRSDITALVRVAGHRKDLVSTALDAGAE